MECDFCGKSHNGDKLIDPKNTTNKFYLTCVANHLRLWECGGYRGYYEINYCPVCGRDIRSDKVFL